jgi:dihydrofolate reductase
MPARLEFSMHVSLDGFIEDSGGSLAWSVPSEELHRFWNEYAATVEGFVMGRGLYEAMVPFWPEAAAEPSGDEIMDEFARIWMSRPRHVFSRSLVRAEGGCELVAGDLIDWARELRREGRGVWSVGGAGIASQLLAEGLIDQLRLTYVPVILGSGKPVFAGDPGQHELRELESREFPGDVRMLLLEPVS